MWNLFEKWRDNLIIHLFMEILIFQIIFTEGINGTLEKSLSDNDISLNYTSYPYKIVIEEIQDPRYKFISVKCDLIHFNKPNGRLMTSNNNQTCENLRPCQKYLVTVQLNYTETNTTVPWVKYIPTKYAKPIIVTGPLMPFNNSIQLHWNSTNAECIKQYDINATATGSSSTHTIANDQTDFEITGLYPCLNYSVHMKCDDVNNVTIFYKNFSVETDFINPGPVKSVKFDYTRNNSTIKVFWEPPKQKFCINFYDLQWALKRNLINNESDKILWHHYNQTDVSVNEYLIQNLTGCENYIFKISTNGDEIDSFNSSFLSPEQVPGPIRELTSHTIFSTNITIMWQAPEQHNSCIREYSIELSEPYNLREVFSTNKTQIFIDEMRPCGKYNFNVRPITLSGNKGPPNNISFTTKSDQPSQVQNVSIQSYPYEIYVVWKPPIFGELCVQQYRVIATYENFDKNDSINTFDNLTNRTTITIKNLAACTKYTIKIMALPNGKIEETKCETTPSIVARPENIELKSSTHNSLEIRASDKDVNNNCQRLFVRFTCKTDDDARIKSSETIVDVNGSISIYTAVVKPLSPFTKYACQVAIFNIAGWSTDSKAVFNTGKYYPEIPSEIQINKTTSNEIHLTWKPPKYPNGNIILYLVHIQSLRPLYKVPSKCPEFEIVEKTVQITKTELTYSDAESYFEYGIQIAVTNDFGVSDFSQMLRVSTNATVPETPNISHPFEINGPLLNKEVYKAAVLISWTLPCRTNGRVSNFQLNFYGKREANEYVQFSRNVSVKDDPLITGKDTFQLNETQLLPDYKYTVEISMHVIGGYSSDYAKAEFTSPAGIPRALNISGHGMIDAFAAKNPTLTALAKFSNDVFKSDLGKIYYAALLVSQKDCQNGTHLHFNVLDSIHNWPNITNWSEAQLNKDCIAQYQTTPIRWMPHFDKPDFINQNSFTFTIGVDSNCNLKANEFCNGPLKPGTKYDVVLRLFTRSAYNDVAVMSFHTDFEVQLILIVILTVTCLLIAFFLGILYLWIRKRMKWHRESINGMEISNGDISAKNFFINYAEISKRDKLCREFKELTTITSDLDLSNYASKSNEPKNRYSNIYPYDKNRVILDSDSEGSDYINASFINGYKKKKEFIATQGPKPDCFIDFWRMILQYNVRVIAMVTEMREGDTIKCHQYFPYHIYDSLRFGHNITVICKKETIQETYERRELNVKHSGYGLSHLIIHYSFKKWPDHDCPNDPTDLINFVRKVKSEKIPNRSPIVVHCSAGVGRTGTFIGLDIIMQKLKSENKINIFETVKELRFQRMKMVQSIQQYQFLYKCTYQLVKKNYSSSSSSTAVSLSIVKNNNTNSNNSNSSSSNHNTNGAIGGEIDDVRLVKNNSSSSLNGRNFMRQQSFAPNEMETSM